jgi:4-methyl-5(b-hydroxyethyl)-thiazole monophosphate biosynthesis
MARALLLLAEGFEEIEAVTVIDILRRASVDVTVAALGASPVRGSHGIAVGADATLADTLGQAFDALILPGGMPGSRHLKEDPRVLELVRQQVAAGKLTAAICAAPIALEAAGVLAGRRATSYPGEELPSARTSEERVVEDGPIVTSRGPGTAIDFALALVTRLVGLGAAQSVREKLLA